MPGRCSAHSGSYAETHELLWYLSEALASVHTRPRHDGLREVLAVTSQLASLQEAELADQTSSRVEALVPAVLRRPARSWSLGFPVNARTTRAPTRRRPECRPILRPASRTCASRLVGARRLGADLRAADLTGADLRDADLSGADLTGSLFLTESQLAAAKGDATQRCGRRSLVLDMAWRMMRSQVRTRVVQLPS